MQYFSKQYLIWLTTALTLGIFSLPLQAIASSKDLQTTPITMADALAAQQHSQDRLNRLAHEMERQIGGQGNSSSQDLTQSNIPLLNNLLGDLLDESGEFRLPLGLTVYDAMGTTSIGFGSRF